jgi:uncharacterized protein
MSMEGEGRLLRIFMGESDQYQHKPLYDQIVQAARDEGMAGATVLRGIEGYGSHSRIHTARILSLSEDLPLVVEIIDTTDRIEAFLDKVGPMLAEALVTVAPIDVRRYRTGGWAP